MNDVLRTALSAHDHRIDRRVADLLTLLAERGQPTSDAARAARNLAYHGDAAFGYDAAARPSRARWEAVRAVSSLPAMSLSGFAARMTERRLAEIEEAQR